MGENSASQYNRVVKRGHLPNCYSGIIKPPFELPLQLLRNSVNKRDATIGLWPLVGAQCRGASEACIQYPTFNPRGANLGIQRAPQGHESDRARCHSKNNTLMP